MIAVGGHLSVKSGMFLQGLPLRTVLLRGAALAAFGLGGGAAVAYVAQTLRAPPAVQPAAVQQAAVQIPAADAVAAAPALAAPSFDIVRVGPQGNAVLAGRAEPGAELVIRDGDAELGRTKADSRGEWVLLPGAPLLPGGRELTVASRLPGTPEQKGDSVVLVVPEPAAAPVPVAALLVPAASAPRLLQGAEAAARPALALPGRTTLGLSSVDYDDRGDIRFAGTAQPGAMVRVYVDNRPAGDAAADAAGRWAMRPEEAMATGVHRLRVDQVTAAGRVQSRVELAFQRTSLPAADLAGGRMVVQPGQNLWRMARQVYGTGIRYTVIYLANREQIRDPRLIYPGQAFATPAP